MPETPSAFTPRTILPRDEVKIAELKAEKDADVKVSQVIQKITELLQDPRVKAYLDSGKNLILRSERSGPDNLRGNLDLYLTPDRRLVDTSTTIGQSQPGKVYEITPSGFIVSEDTHIHPKSGASLGTPLGRSFDFRTHVTRGEITPESIQKQVEYQITPLPLSEAEQQFFAKLGPVKALQEKLYKLILAGKGKAADERRVEKHKNYPPALQIGLSSNYEGYVKLLNEGLQLTPEDNELLALAQQVQSESLNREGPADAWRYVNYAQVYYASKELLHVLESATATVNTHRTVPVENSERTFELKPSKFVIPGLGEVTLKDKPPTLAQRIRRFLGR